MTAETIETTGPINLDPYLAEIEDLSVMECDSQVLQALSFIAGYSTQQFLKRNQVCTLCYQFLTLDKNLLLEELENTQFKLISLCDRAS